MADDPAITDLLARATTVAQRRRLSLNTVSKKLFDDTYKLERLREGTVSVTLRVLHEARLRLADLEQGCEP